MNAGLDPKEVPELATEVSHLEDFIKTMVPFNSGRKTHEAVEYH